MLASTSTWQAAAVSGRQDQLWHFFFSFITLHLSCWQKCLPVVPECATAQGRQLLSGRAAENAGRSAPYRWPTGISLQN